MSKITGRLHRGTVPRRGGVHVPPAAKCLLAAALILASTGLNDPAVAQPAADAAGASLTTSQLIDLLVKRTCCRAPRSTP